MAVQTEPKSLIDTLAETAKVNGHTATCAKLKSGAYVIYVSPETNDKVNAVLHVALGIASQEESQEQ